VHAKEVSTRAQTPAAQAMAKSSGVAQMVDRSPRGLALAATKAMLQQSPRHAPVQRIMDKAKLSKSTYTARLRSTVILYAELNGKPVGTDGVFMSSSSGHAEDALIAALGDEAKGSLVIWLSASPCSSTFSTRKDEDEDGCQEKLEKLNSKTLSVEVRADHLYQPKDLGGSETDHGYATGFSSASAAVTSAFPLSVSHASKAVQNSISGLEIRNDKVAQLRRP